MHTTATLGFSIGPLHEGDSISPTLALTPILNGTLLTELVSSFEAEHFEPPIGGYGGLVPAFFRHPPLSRYFFGDWGEENQCEDPGQIYVLGCACGEVGCWPLVCRIRLVGHTVVWDSFRQPHRPARNYLKFGPFVFNAEQYRQAVADLEADLSTQGQP